ncbi:MAG: pentapeptide repeat-containing protein [Symploca sp. SIO1C4]|uniref:Pentapeptide repeat-containing protein n=1 Tax=Symploca sp. SIO1C4 TaxID=2607765 RepID=A0A6B3NEI3_9CYAN|nr:pentapeptide repeat-containing protein [Symploca sp. SIO1C4]
MAERINKNLLKLYFFKFHQPFISIEKKVLEPILDYLKRLALLEILGLMGNVSLIIGVIVFVSGEKQRRNAEIYQAWQVITAAYNQSGSGGRKEALEFLNSEPRRIPWFWMRWERQSLRGLEAPKAYLKEIQLPEADLLQADLQQANLLQANLQEAFLWQVNLQQAVLIGANLQQADLSRANLQEAFLWQANLQQTNLSRTNLKQAKLWGTNLKQTDLSDTDLHQAFYTDETTSEDVCKKFFLSYPCPTKFPEAFNPKAAGMKLIKEWKDIPKRENDK